MVCMLGSQAPNVLRLVL
ncbi:unnamed protein product, partial [Tilletia laevis]